MSAAVSSVSSISVYECIGLPTNPLLTPAVPWSRIEDRATLNRMACCSDTYHQNTTCVDGGLGRKLNGGNVTVSIISYGDDMGVDMDSIFKDPEPFLVMYVAGAVVGHPTKGMSPGMSIAAGYHASGSLLRARLFDKDGGFELGPDKYDLLGDPDIGFYGDGGLFTTPFCTPLTGAVASPSYHCDDSSLLDKTAKGFSVCPNSDSSWRMPLRPSCTNVAVLSLDGQSVADCFEGQYTTDPYAVVPVKKGRRCLKLRVDVVPFMVEDATRKVDVVPLGIAADTGDNSGDFHDFETDHQPWADLYGRLHSDDISALYIGAWNYEPVDEASLRLDGSLTVLTAIANRDVPETTENLMQLETNFWGTWYVCRHEQDSLDFPILSWMSAEGYEPATEFKFTADTRIVDGVPNVRTRRTCMKRLYPPTRRDKYGYTENPAAIVNLGGNRPVGMPDGDAPRAMYTVFILPAGAGPPVPEEAAFDYTLETGKFAITVLQFGVMLGVTGGILYSHLSKNISFRLERIETYLATRSQTGQDKTVLARLFANDMLTENNVEFRRHLYWAAWCVRLAMCTPFVILWSWGISCAVSVNPPAVGFGILFVGTGIFALTYGITLWRQSGWRMSVTTMRAGIVAFASVLLYALAVAFVDPAVYVGGHEIDVTALGLAFGAMNCVPLIGMAFLNDKGLRKSARQVDAVLELSASKMGAASSGQGGKQKRSSSTGTGWHGHGSAFNQLLGDAWSVFDVNSDAKATAAALAAASAIGEPPPPPVILAAAMFDAGADVTRSSLLATPEKRRFLNRVLYQISLYTLVAYFIVLALATEHAADIAAVNAISLTLIDGIHFSLSHGSCDWSPGFQSALICLSRLAIMASGRDGWLIGYSITFLAYGISLSREVVRKRLPTLTDRVAAGVAYYGYPAFQKFKGDVSGTPVFCLGAMSLYFVLLVVFCERDAITLPMPVVDVGGLCVGHPWPAYSFGGLAFLIVLVTCVGLAARDAAYLHSRQLLAGSLAESFLFSKGFRLPMILAAGTEILVIITGLFMWASTGCSPLFTISVFGPVIVATAVFVYLKWVKNDYSIVPWPPALDNFEVISEENEDQLVQNMIGSLFGADKDKDKEGGGDKELFKLPPLVKTGSEIRGEIKMPPLPLKSALKYKQQVELKAAANAGNPQASAAEDGRKGGEGGDDDMADMTDLESMEEQLSGEKGVVAIKLPTVRNKFKHQRVTLSGLVYDFTQKYRMLKPLGKVGASLCGCLCKVCKGKKKAKVSVDGGVPGAEGEESDFGAESDTPNFEEVDFAAMSIFEAATTGYLLADEYAMLAATFLLFACVFFMGLAISLSENLGWIGHLIWVVIYVILLTGAAVLKYFNTYGGVKKDRFVSGSFAAAGITHLVFSIVVFVCQFGADPNNGVSGLVIINLLTLYPLTVMMSFKLYEWKDNNWLLVQSDQQKDGRMSIKEKIQALGIAPLAVIAFTIFSVELFFFANYYLAVSILLILGAVVVVLAFLKDWAMNDFWLSAIYQERADKAINAMQVLALVAVFLLPSESTMFCLSLMFIFYMVECAANFGAALITYEKEDPLYFSPYILPAYSFSAATDDVKDESETVIWCFKFLGAGCAWGVCIAMFVAPLSTGIFITCFFFLTVICCIAACLGHVPLQLGEIAKYISKLDVYDSAGAARDKFQERQKPVEIFVAEYEGKNFSKNDWMQDEGGESREDKFAGFEAYRLACTVEGSLTSMRYTDDNESDTKRVNLAGDDDDDEGARKVTEKLPRADGVWNWEDALAESLITNRGPFGFLGMFGAWYEILTACNNVRLCYHSTSVNKYDAKGGRKLVAKADGPVDVRRLLKDLTDYDVALDKRYLEEVRAAIHFTLMLVTSCDARLKHEKVNFQKFLRENRFKLLSNGLKPPSNIWGSGTKSNFDVAIVATWLSGLTPEERERFHMLRSAFNVELASREREIDKADEDRRVAAARLREKLLPIEEKNCAKRFEKLTLMRNARLDNWKATQLDAAEKLRFKELQVKWMADPNVEVAPADSVLRGKFEQHVIVKTDEGILESRNFLKDVESGEKYCRPGKFGRAFQFHDPDFPANAFALGQGLAVRDRVKDWKQSTQINNEAVLFSGGTDPDDVRRGVINDGWFLSAVSMLAAAGGVGDGDVDAQVANLFVSQVGADGQPRYNSDVGVYGIRLFKNNQWEVVIVDDFFPCMGAEDAENSASNKGSIVGHSDGFKAIWVSVLEKAYAKYHGSYEVLQDGFVQHALKELTGAETDCVSLSSASKGAGKQALWNQILRWRRNGYILGCGSHPANVKFAFDTGIVPEAAYVIYDVRSVDGYKLLRLRNPPGVDEEWKGEWSDKSSCWTTRLKKKLNWSNADDNCFWMCFDDFCEIFREVYNCKWFDKSKWKSMQINGEWEIGGKVTRGDVEVERENTAVGLPSLHNVGCHVESNPQYTLEIDRPTEIRLRLEQCDSSGLASATVHFVACYITKSGDDFAARVKELTKKNVLYSTGLPRKERNLEIYCTLQPGTYVILCATYVAMNEGPFRLSILSNFEVETKQLWPPTWRNDEPDTFAGKMAAKLATAVGTAALEAANAASKGAAAASEAASKVNVKDALMGAGGDLELTAEDQDLENQLAKEQADLLEAAKKKARDDAFGAAARGED